MRALDDLRSRIPLDARHRLALARVRCRMPTARWRALPGALVIGAQRSGTSSLYRYLGGHPDAAPSLRKEVEYFSRRFDRGDGWYRAHFPIDAAKHRLAFEATPDYLFHPLAASRAAAVVPDVRLVAVLRDPVARAWSHHQHMVALGYETLDFDDAIAAEEERCYPDLARLEQDPFHDPKALLRFSYVARGRYAGQLERWFACFPAERLLVVRSEDLFASPAMTFGSIVEHLGLRAWAPPAFPNVSRQVRPEAPTMSATAREHLEEIFRQPNAELVSLLGAGAPRW
jgi:hypothetical protein